VTETLLTVQQFSIYGIGGGPRILRSLLEDAPWDTVSVSTGEPSALMAGSIREEHLRARPGFGRLERTRLKRQLNSLELLRGKTLRRGLTAIVDREAASAVHAVAHGFDFVAAHGAARDRDLPFLLTVHDHPAYIYAGYPTQQLALRKLGASWRDAAHRFAITTELGNDLCDRFGPRPFSVVTDGISEVAKRPMSVSHDRRVYFMGLFHISYRANLVALLQSLADYRDRHQADVSVVLRGAGPELSAAERAGVPVTVLPWGTQSDVAEDLGAADLLYLPLPFGPEHRAFVRYSLSTKMVTFLGSGVPILYHGPAEAAAARLLRDSNAAVTAYSLDPAEITDALAAGPETLEETVSAATNLANEQFLLEQQRQRFWAPLLGSTRTASVLRQKFVS
jgi:hypothetical protein